jgi:hypothetical protein
MHKHDRIKKQLWPQGWITTWLEERWQRQESNQHMPSPHDKEEKVNLLFFSFFLHVPTFSKPDIQA